ncbi:hypothetical protein GCM10011331_22950 [Flavimobilis marinus]|uniref:Uncharacterized protein n=1 Tax=Flavimobilis marinus TaxID=285351 RepID=A0A1I2GP66_9MICO|nr:hypothetical protein [Flavimobilis marinus]GHG55921.1 hypothetical protein GCM10011331_22950 [Flavimobilis marinus]SFF18799.1 hypothetical protein SAMN04488035_1875 [Flavimobilis marinus]
MPRQLLLEGSDLDALVRQARAELGPGVKVVKAERVREGGFGGFFAKERFELTVEVPDDVPARGGAVRGQAGGIDALLAAADAADVSGHGVGGVPGARGPADAFASVLDSVRQLAQGIDVGVGGPASPVPPVAPRRSAAEAADDVIDVVELGEVPVSVAPAPAAVQPPAAAPAKPRAKQKTQQPKLQQPAAEPAGGDDVRFTAMHATVVTSRRGATADELATIGMPDALVAALRSRVPSGTRFTLSEVLSQVPRAPEVLRRPGSVVVVSGKGTAATEAAHVVARRMGLTDDRIALAGEFAAGAKHQWVTTPATARRLAEEARRSGEPLLVALTVGAGRFDEAEAADLVGALQPDQVWAAVDADRAPEDTRRWIAALERTRPVDALAARGVAETSRPGSILTLGVPVGLLDGLVASAPVWAAMLSERLDDPVWD